MRRRCLYRVVTWNYMEKGKEFAALELEENEKVILTEFVKKGSIPQVRFIVMRTVDA